jgi:membrane associated rhomboid family serine protease
VLTERYPAATMSHVTHDTAAPRQPILNLPAATKALIVANVVVFALMLVLPDAWSDAASDLLGFVPARYPSFTFWALVDPITYQFVHAGFAHIAVNMLGLAAFGAGVEQRLGRARYVLFYLVCGIAGAATEWALDPASQEAMVGASAAISGLFGGILRLAVFRRGFWLLVVLWLVMNAVAGVSGLGAEGEPVAWVAHIGGFAAGLLLYPLLVPRALRGK